MGRSRNLTDRKLPGRNFWRKPLRVKPRCRVFRNAFGVMDLGFDLSGWSGHSSAGCLYRQRPAGYKWKVVRGAVMT